MVKCPLCNGHHASYETLACHLYISHPDVFQRRNTIVQCVCGETCFVATFRFHLLQYAPVSDHLIMAALGLSENQNEHRP